MNKYLLIYHKEDNDGVCSAAMVANRIIKQNKDNFNLIYFPATYKLLTDLYQKGNDYLNEYFDNYTHIIMCDISFNEYKGMVYLKNKFKQNFIWFDHHLPIIKESFKYKFDDICGIRDHTRSTILNVYKYFYDEFDILYNNKELPKLLWYLSTYDSWTHKENGLNFDETMFVNTSITKTSNLSIQFWLQEIEGENNETLIEILCSNDERSKNYNNDFIDKARIEGETICIIKDKHNAELIENNGDFTWTIEGTNRKVCMLVSSSGSSSLVFKSLRRPEDTPIPDNYDKNLLNGVIFKKTKDSEWTFSLYNINDDDTFNCGEYLKTKYKGGGHVGAAGATVSQAKFIKMLKTRKI
jgi:oligoribonuclease NrnB/cAMP/cGMP phosphodiesterase (DHH superfamily)